MDKRTKRRIYEYAARVTVFFHILTVVLFFTAIPLMFVDGWISLVAAVYLVVVWIQYKALGICFLTIWENYFMRKAGKKTHAHFVSRQLNKLVRGGRKDSSRFKQFVDKWSWNLKTVCFVIALLVIFFYFF